MFKKSLLDRDTGHVSSSDEQAEHAAEGARKHRQLNEPLEEPEEINRSSGFESYRTSVEPTEFFKRRAERDHDAEEVEGE